MPALTKEYLRKTKCGIPGCTSCHHQIYLSSKCHPESGFGIVFDKELDSLLIICKECETLVAKIAVVERIEDEDNERKRAAN